MSGPLAWQVQTVAVVAADQTITANTETVVCTLGNINSRGPGFPVFFDGSVYFDVQAATTLTTVRIRQDSLTGSLVGVAQAAGATAATMTKGGVALGGVDIPPGEYAGKVYVLTVQSTAAGANWLVHFAQLQALY